MSTETLELDYALALDHGQRPYQEDAVLADFNAENGLGIAVLADGMGGHAAGDVASRMVVTTVFERLKSEGADPARLLRQIGPTLKEAADRANADIGARGKSDRSKAGMGATLLATVFHRDRLFWLSVGDSPLYLFRDGRLTQLNEDHSMARQLDNLAKLGQMSAEEAKSHPDRYVLTSALTGRKIPLTDCPEEPRQIAPGDIVILASDGLQYLPDQRIQEVLAANSQASAPAICRALMEAVDALDHPHQDNISIVVVRP